ncbi:hypothetical protein [Desulfosarcina ovata]|uniref:hypothetical protein n=1 Tax=Desulfosarcina ovata TaxID=83564 RepID=UPI0015659798|nr:hypothetical protein [Desulfosarcina ovata]
MTQTDAPVTPDTQKTQSLCPDCLALLPARRVIRGNRVYLEKHCPEHGSFSVRIWDGEPAFTGWQRPKIPTRPAHCGHPVEAITTSLAVKASGSTVPSPPAGYAARPVRR